MKSQRMNKKKRNENLNDECQNLVSSIVKVCWESINEWTAALNLGVQHLKKIVNLLLNCKPNTEPPLCYENSLELGNAVQKMQKATSKLKEMEKQLKKIIEAKNIISYQNPILFKTYSLSKLDQVISHLAKCYEKETAVKTSACVPLTCTKKNVDTLNLCITLWVTHSCLPQPHLYEIKKLLIETDQLYAA